MVEGDLLCHDDLSEYRSQFRRAFPRQGRSAHVDVFTNDMVDEPPGVCAQNGTFATLYFGPLWSKAADRKSSRSPGRTGLGSVRDPLESRQDVSRSACEAIDT